VKSAEEIQQVRRDTSDCSRPVCPAETRIDTATGTAHNSRGKERQT